MGRKGDYSAQPSSLHTHTALHPHASLPTPMPSYLSCINSRVQQRGLLPARNTSALKIRHPLSAVIVGAGCLACSPGGPCSTATRQGSLFFSVQPRSIKKGDTSKAPETPQHNTASLSDLWPQQLQQQHQAEPSSSRCKGAAHPPTLAQLQGGACTSIPWTALAHTSPLSHTIIHKPHKLPWPHSLCTWPLSPAPPQRPCAKPALRPSLFSPATNATQPHTYSSLFTLCTPLFVSLPRPQSNATRVRLRRLMEGCCAALSHRKEPGGPTPSESAISGAMGSSTRMAVSTATAVALARASPAGVTLSAMYRSAVRWQMMTYRPAGGSGGCVRRLLVTWAVGSWLVGVGVQRA